MTWKLVDETSTEQVVAIAAVKIGKSITDANVQKIIDYLVTKNWFQSAGDLRAGILDTQAWTMLEVPARLKIILQELLAEKQAAILVDLTSVPRSQPVAASSPVQDTSKASDTAEAPMASSEPSAEEAVQDVQGEESTYYGYYATEFTSEAVVETDLTETVLAAATEASQQDYTGYEGYDAGSYSSYDQYTGYDPSTYTYENYTEAYDAESYDTAREYAAPTEEQYSYENQSTTDATEATVDVSQTAIENNPEPSSTTQDAPLVPSTSWACRMCTFVNRIEESFCEMCYDHISLSIDLSKTSTDSHSSASNNNTPATFMTSLPAPAPTPSPSPAVTTAADATSVIPAASSPSTVERSTSVRATIPAELRRRGTFSPSAPDFDLMDQLEDVDTTEGTSTPPPSPLLSPTLRGNHEIGIISAEIARKMAFGAKLSPARAVPYPPVTGHGYEDQYEVIAVAVQDERQQSATAAEVADEQEAEEVTPSSPSEKVSPSKRLLNLHLPWKKKNKTQTNSPTKSPSKAHGMEGSSSCEGEYSCSDDDDDEGEEKETSVKPAATSFFAKAFGGKNSPSKQSTNGGGSRSASSHGSNSRRQSSHENSSNSSGSGNSRSGSEASSTQASDAEGEVEMPLGLDLHHPIPIALAHNSTAKSLYPSTEQTPHQQHYIY